MGMKRFFSTAFLLSRVDDLFYEESLFMEVKSYWLLSEVLELLVVWHLSADPQPEISTKFLHVLCVLVRAVVFLV